MNTKDRSKVTVEFGMNITPGFLDYKLNITLSCAILTFALVLSPSHKCKSTVTVHKMQSLKQGRKLTVMIYKANFGSLKTQVKYS